MNRLIFRLIFGAPLLIALPANAGLTVNAFTANSLTQNGLMFNGLSANSLVSNALVGNGQAATGAAGSWTGEPLKDLNGVQVDSLTLSGERR